MSNKDLVYVAAKIRNVTRCRNTMGERGVLGIRVQPNHPADDLAGILLAAVDGLLFGCGDAVIGVNPATESVETVAAILRRLDRLIDEARSPDAGLLPGAHHHATRGARARRAGRSALSVDRRHAGGQRQLRRHARPAAGRPRARAGIAPPARRGLGRRAGDVLRDGPGQRPVGRGASRRRSAHARSPGVWRGPRVRSVPGQQRRRLHRPGVPVDERQIIRAGLEDHFMGKLLGLPMGVDVCYTNHAAADQNSADNLLLLLAAAGCNYFMGVPCADDVMLNYQSTSYHDAATVRQLFGLRPAPEFARVARSARHLSGRATAGWRTAPWLGSIEKMLSE